ncbi:MAG: LysM peptidoglycan-binding domain-containing protein [Caldilineaceae bacterium]
MIPSTWRIVYRVAFGLLLLTLLLHVASGTGRAAERKHVVQPGETLSQIADKYGLSTTELMDLNNISDPNSLRVGQELLLPDPNAPTATASPIYHIVSAGEPLSAIAEYYGVSEESILEANKLDGPSSLKWGQKLIIPTQTPTGTPPTATPTPKATATTASTKTPNATATPQDTATAETQIIESQTDESPTGTPTDYAPLLHTVRSGETASGIAEFYGIPLSRLLEVNHIDDPNSLVIGQQLAIPDVEPTVTPSPEPTEPSQEEITPGTPENRSPQITSLNRTYTVQYPNDSIGYIALRYGLDPEALRAINRMPSVRSPVEVGTVLLLPATDRELYVQPNVPPSQLHVMQPDESLEGVANENGLTLGDLMYANRIGNPDNVENGQQIVIPQKGADGKVKQMTPRIGTGRSGYFFYTVRAGDTASTLAEKLNTNGNAIINYNDFPNLDTIFLGMEIRSPFGPPALPVRQPPVPTSGTSFVVSIGRQECWVFWGKTIARSWRCSTGFGDTKTRLGNFAVQSKIAMARSSAYQLDMPFWLGIYNAGAYENGIHGLPIDLWKNKKIWTELVGQPATFGCAMLGDEDAEELFNMAYLGMPVYVIK